MEVEVHRWKTKGECRNRGAQPVNYCSPNSGIHGGFSMGLKGGKEQRRQPSALSDLFLRVSVGKSKRELDLVCVCGGGGGVPLA